MISIDTPTLTNLITTCFNLSMDGRLSDNVQREFLVAGKRLRGCLVNLLSATFNDGTQDVIDANKRLTTINGQVLQLTNDLSTAADVLSQVNVAVGVLAQLLKLASSFH